MPSRSIVFNWFANVRRENEIQWKVDVKKCCVRGICDNINKNFENFINCITFVGFMNLWGFMKNNHYP